MIATMPGNLVRVVPCPLFVRRRFPTLLESDQLLRLFSYLIISVPPHRERNNLTRREVTLPEERVPNYTFKCST